MKISGENLICQSCGRGVTVLIVSPITKGESLTCKDCAVKTGIYCQRHDLVHQGFFDESSACLECVEELVQTKLDQATVIRKRVFDSLEKDAQENFEEWLQVSSKVTEDPKDVCLLRAAASLAIRRRASLEETVRQIVLTGNWRAEF